MVRITFVEHNGGRTEVDAVPGFSIMKSATNAGVPGIAADCGGNCACGTCRIYVPQEWLSKLPPAEVSEREMLEFVQDAHEGVRLSCQVQVAESLNGMIVGLPKDQHT